MPGNIADELINKENELNPLVADEFVKEPIEDPIEDSYRSVIRKLFDKENEEIGTKTAISEGIKKQPSRQADVMNLAKEFKVSTDFVERNYDELIKNKKTRDIDVNQILLDSPATARWLRNTDNAALGQNDIPHLRSLERISRELSKAERDTRSIIKDYSTATKKGFHTNNIGLAFAAVTSGQISIDEAIGQITASTIKQNELNKMTPDYVKIYEESLTKELGERTKASRTFSESIDKFNSDQVITSMARISIASKELLGETLDLFLTVGRNLKAAGYSSMENIPNTLPAVIGGIEGAIAGAAIGLVTPITPIAGAKAGGAIGFFAGGVASEEGMSIVEDVRKLGIDLTDREAVRKILSNSAFMNKARSRGIKKGIGTSAIDTLFTFLGAKVATGAFARKTIRGKFAGLATAQAIDVVGEGLGEGAGQLLREDLDPSKVSVDEMIRESLMSIFSPVSIVIGTISKTAQVAEKKIIERREKVIRDNYDADPDIAVVQIAEDIEKSQTSFTDAENLVNLFDAIEGVEDVKKVEGRIESLVALATEDEDQPNVFYQIDEFNDFFADKGILPAEIVDKMSEKTRKSYNEAVANGTDFEMPIAEFTEIIAANKDLRDIIKITRVKENGKTLQEASEFIRNSALLIKTVAKQHVEKEKKKKIELSSEEQIFENMRKQLMKAGFNRDDSRPQALIYKSLVGHAATIMRRDPKEFFDTLGLTVKKVGIVEKIKKVIKKPELFQKGKRAKIEILNDKITITLLKNANKTSFIHETGHAFLEIVKRTTFELNKMKDLETDQLEYLENSKNVLEWLGVESWDDLTTEHHEKWAKGFEVYLGEGKAPNEGLRKAFARFKQWMIGFYNDLRNIGVELSPKVREMMGSLLAAKDEVSKSIFNNNQKGLFESGKEVGMTDEQSKRYEAARIEMNMSANEIVTAKVFEDLERKDRVAYKSHRKIVKEEVTNEINRDLRYVAVDSMRNDKTPDGTPYKLSKDAIIEIIGEDKLKQLPKGIYVVEGGFHPDIVSQGYDFDDGEKMLNALLNLENKTDAIDRITDQQMELDSPSILTEEKEMKAIAVEAVMTEKQVKVSLLELEHLATADLAALKGIVRTLTKVVPTSSQVRLEAKEIIRKTEVSGVKPHRHQASARKFSRLAGEEFARGNIDLAFKHKLSQVLNLQLYIESKKAKAEINRSLKFFKKFAQRDKKLATTREISVVNAGRVILEKFGLGKVDTQTLSEDIELLKRNDRREFNRVETFVDSLDIESQDYKAMSFEQFSEMSETVKSLWELSRSEKQSIVEGQMIDRELQLEELSRDMNKLSTKEKSDIGLEDSEKNKKGLDRTTTKLEALKTNFLSVLAMGTRVEHWSRRMGKAFTRHIHTPVSEAVDKFNIEKKRFTEEYLAVVQERRKHGFRKGKIVSLELNFEFQNIREVIGMLTHIGNDSNKRKLLLGYGWATLNEDGSIDASRFDAFMNRMFKEGIIKKYDMDYVQAIWDLTKKLKPEAQQAHKRIHGRFFNEITSLPIQTPWGEYEGGYVPAMIDSSKVEDQRIKDDIQALEEEQNSILWPSTGEGFTKERVEYNVPLVLDINMFSSHMDKVLRFTHIQPIVKEVSKIINNKNFRKQLGSINPAIASDMLVPWLQRAASQKVEAMATTKGGRTLNNFARKMRTRAGMDIMFFNTVNTLQQYTGFAITLTRVERKHLVSAFVEYAQNRENITEMILNKSEFMVTRNGSQMIAMSSTIREIALDPSAIEKGRDWVNRNAYFMQEYTQSYVDKVTWLSAYNQSVSRGESEHQSVREANAIVRMTQGSFAPQDISRSEAGQAWIRIFTMFYSYFNMQANLLGNEFKKTIDEVGLKKGAGKLLNIYALTIVIPSVLGELIMKAGTGRLDEDDDGSVLDDIALIIAFAPLRNLLSLVPVVGGLAQTGINQFDTKFYNDDIRLSPAISQIQSSFGVLKAISNKINQRDVNGNLLMRDSLKVISLMTGVPVSAIGKPIRYVGDVSSGRATPRNPIDAARGFITGKPGR